MFTVATKRKILKSFVFAYLGFLGSATSLSLNETQQVLERSQAISTDPIPVNVVTTSSDTFYLAIKEGWNLLSLPGSVTDCSIKTLFPSAISHAFVYEGSYKPRDSLVPGQGYWIKFSSPETITVIASHLDEYSTPLRRGWNLLGSSWTSIRVDQIDADPCNVKLLAPLYVYDPTTGYQSTDSIYPGQAAWVKVNEDGVLYEKKWVKMTGIPFSALSPLPTNPDILIGATSSNFSEGTLGAIMKSTDAGLTWATLVGNVDAGYGNIVIDPTNSDIIYAGLGSVNTCQPGIIKSTDGGDNWFRSDTGIVEDLDCNSWAFVQLIDPNDVNTLYATGGGIDIGNRIYKSTDAGVHWFKLEIYSVANCSLESWFQNGSLTLAIDPKHSNVMFAGTELDSVLYWSTDYGHTWEIRHCFGGAGGSTGGINSVCVDPNDSNIVFVGAKGFFRSYDRGASWEASNTGLEDIDFGVKLVPTANHDVFYAQTSCFYRTLNGGTSWEKVKCDTLIAIFESIDEAGKRIYVSNPGGVYRMSICVQSTN